jgi:hypothetical protein
MLSDNVYSAFDHGDPLEPTQSRRYATCRRISERAWTKLKACQAGLLVVPKNDDESVIWYRTLYMTYCHPHTKSLAERLNRHTVGKGTGTGTGTGTGKRKRKADGEDKDTSTLPPNFFVLGLDECSILNVRAPSRGDQAHNVMSLLAVQRIIQAADAAPALDGGFTIWYTLLDTSSAVTELVPPRNSGSASLRLRDSLKPLPPWSLLGYDQMVPAQRSLSPSEANQITHLRMFGRPVSKFRLVVFSSYLIL